MDNPKQRIRLKCRYDNEIRIVIISPDYTFSQLYNRLTLDYGFDISLKYEDQDGDLITLTSQNDFEDLLLTDSDVINVIVSENMLPSLSKRQPKVTSLWSQGAAVPTAASVNWAKEQHINQQRSQSPFLHAPSSSFASTRLGSTNRLLERFPLIESSGAQTPPVSERATRWKRGEILGRGAFGVVYLGLNVESGELMAVKQISNDEIKTKELSSLENEISVLRSLKHPNIVRYIGTETNPNTLSIFLEYVPGGSLKSLIDKFGKLEEPVVRSYTRQLLLGLEYLHRNGIAHRDIKGANCLVGNDGAVKLADFGASNSWRSSTSVGLDGKNVSAQESGSHDVKGTPSWMSPEVIRGEKPLNWKKADVWSLGCTTIEMTTGSPPWSQFNNPVTVLYQIACSEALPEYPENPSIELLTFLNSCLKRDHNERTDITSLLLHPFVASLQVQGGPGGGSWSTGNWGQRPSTVSTTPAGECTDTISQWKVLPPPLADSSVLTSSRSRSRDEEEGSDLKMTPRLGNSSARMLEAHSTPALLESSSNPRPFSPSNLADLDLESTVSRHQIIDTNAIVRAHSYRSLNNTNFARRQSLKTQIMSDNLSPLTVQELKKDDDKQQISDLLSVASLENSIETFPDDLDDSTSTLGSGRVLLESLEGMVSHDNMKIPIQSNRNLVDVKISPIFDLDDDTVSLDNSNSKPNINTQKSTEAKFSSKDDIKKSSSRELTRKNSGSSGTSTSTNTSTNTSKLISKKGKLAPGMISSSNKQSANKSISSSNNSSTAFPKDTVRNPPPTLMSPVKQPSNSANFTKNLDLKLASNNDKVIEKVIKPLSRMACAGVDSNNTTKKVAPPPLQTAGMRPPPAVSTTVPASPIRISSLNSRTKAKPFEYSTRPGEKNSSSTTASGTSANATSRKNKKIVNTNKSANALSVRKKSLDQSPDEEENTTKTFSTSNRSNADEIKDEAEVHDEEIEFHGREEDDGSVADELSDDSGVHMGAHNDEDSSDMMEFSSCMDDSMTCDWLSTTAKGERSHIQYGDSKKQGDKDNWSATEIYTKEKKYRSGGGQSHSQSPTKQGLGQSQMGQSQSSSSLLTSEKISDPNIGMYALVGHSLKQGAGGGSGAVQGTRIKTSLPSSKMASQRNTKSSLGNTSSVASTTAAKQGALMTSRGGETSAFRNLKIAGDSIDLRLGTAATAGAATPLTSLQKQGGDRFFDESLDGFDNMPHKGDDESEDSLTLPLHSEAEELDEHTSAVTKLRMVLNKNIFLSASLDSSIRIWGTEGSTSSRAVLDIPSFDSKAKKAMPTTQKPVKFCGLWVDSNCDFIWGGCSDGIIRVWTGGEGKPYRMVKGHEDLVTNIEGAPLEHMSSHTCASAALDKTARVWDTRAKKAQCALFRGHTDTIYSLKWLDGGRSIATASKDKTIKVWDVRTGRLQNTLDKHYGTVNLLKTLPDDFRLPARKDSGGDAGSGSGGGSYFLSAARDGIMSLWSSDGTCLASQGAHRTAVTCMSDVQTWHSGSSSDGGRGAGRRKDPMLYGSGPRAITSGMDSIVRVWDIRRMKTVSEFSLPHVVKVAWFNQSIVTGTSTGEMYLWDYYDNNPDTAGTDSGGGGDEGENPSRGWSARELTHHSHQCSDIVTSKYCVASASKSGNILRYSAM